jgi:hypothetical protein
MLWRYKQDLEDEITLAIANNSGSKVSPDVCAFLMHPKGSGKAPAVTTCKTIVVHYIIASFLVYRPNDFKELAQR